MKNALYATLAGLLVGHLVRQAQQVKRPPENHWPIRPQMFTAVGYTWVLS